MIQIQIHPISSAISCVSRITRSWLFFFCVHFFNRKSRKTFLWNGVISTQNVFKLHSSHFEHTVYLKFIIKIFTGRWTISFKQILCFHGHLIIAGCCNSEEYLNATETITTWAPWSKMKAFRLFLSSSLWYTCWLNTFLWETATLHASYDSK